MQKKIVTRFAPSPTGYIHIGNLRAAIPPYLIARQTGGKFLLRIEDTDQARFVDGATELILSTLRTIGIDWDGDPIYQTARKDTYYKYAEQLISAGRAYADPTPSEAIATYREADTAAKKPYLYRNHRPDSTPEWHPGIPLRFRAEPRDYEYHDEIMGDLTASQATQDDFILIKADGLPTYNFAHIVDDHEMGINLVMRGVEYLPSMGNYLALHDALGIPHPTYAHMPHILAPTGNKKLGKRDGAKSANDYFEDGILPEAMLNFLIGLGWNDGTEQEIYTKDELIEKFKLEDMQRSGARFDEQKLLWLNGQWIRKLATEGDCHPEPSDCHPELASGSIPPTDLPGLSTLYQRTLDFWPPESKGFKDSEKQAVLAIIYDRLKTLSDLRTFTTYFFADPRMDLKLITENKFLKKLSELELINLLQKVQSALDDTPWHQDQIQTTLNDLLQTTGLKPAVLFSLIRISLTFAPFSPDLAAIMQVLGKPTTLARLSRTIAALTAD